MNTAIVMNICGRSALVMKAGGEFVNIRAQKGWKKGDVVCINSKTHHLKALYVAAACFSLVLLGSFGWYQLYFTEAALISIDINPSIELRLNHLDRIMDTAHYNEDGENLLSSLDLKGKKYGAVLEDLFQSEALLPYLENNEYLDITVSGNEALNTRIQIQAQTLTASFPLQVSCHRADAETVATAHVHGMTPGRYLAFLELQALDPDVVIEDYASCGIGQIHKEIESCHKNGYGQTEGYCGYGQGFSNNTNTQYQSSQAIMARVEPVARIMTDATLTSSLS